MGSRRQARVFALQTLYLMDICKISLDDAFAIIWSGLSEPEKIKNFSREIAEGSSKNLEYLDSLIIKFAENWELNRMACIDRNILRLSAYELVFCPQTPISVVIDEAVEMAKEYSTADSGKFVNGILDKIKTERKNSYEEKTT